MQATATRAPLAVWLAAALAAAGCKQVDEAYQGAHPTDNCMERYKDPVNQERCKTDQRDGG